MDSFMKNSISGRALSMILLCLTLLLDSTRPAPAQAIVYLDITSANVRKVNIAVPYFIDKKQPGTIHDGGKKMADLLGRALAFHGFVDIIDPSAYSGSQTWDWPALGAEFTVLGQYEMTADGLVLEMRLNEIQSGHMILGRRYQTPVSKHKESLKKFCDEVVLLLTGERGVSFSRIAFVSTATGHKEIWLADVLGEDIRQITQHEHLAVSPRFSPDNKWLAYTSYHRNNPNLYITELNVLKSTRAISRQQGLNMAPAWSPDGSVIALTLSKSINPDIYLIDNNGKELRRLTQGEGINVSPTWSPDGKKLAFVSDRSGSPQIYIMDVATKATQRLTYLGNENTTPNWSPKGDWIAYTGRVNGNTHILMIKPEGGTPVQLTQTAGDHESPSWSPDGRQIVFSRKRNNKQEICAIYKNGMGLRPLFNLKGSQSTPQWSPHQNL
ncbi:MAG: Tol-Pal system beta propeller repeat protein TolB [Pseudomonadota bacterium]